MNQSSDADVVVIGGGPGGYVAAIRAAQAGMRVICIEDRPALGGTCLNVGCIPSKALLNSSRYFWESKERWGRHGIVIEGLSLDLPAMMRQKSEAVRTLTSGIDHLFRKHKIERIQGRGRLTVGRVAVSASEGGTRDIEAPSIVVATGSAPIALKDIPIDEQRIVTSTGALALPEVPEHLVVIGGGYIGLELGSVWARLGSRVTCLEMTDRLLPGMDHELATQLQRILEKQGLTVRLQTKVAAARRLGETIEVSLASSGEGRLETLQCSHLLIAVGRRPSTDGLGLEQAGIDVDEHGFIKIDRQFRTTTEGVFAIGDVAGPPLLAHKAMDEAVACIDGIAGRTGYVNYDAIPAVVYTWPEVASVGRTEDELQANGVTYRAGRFPYRANSRGRCTGDLDGFVKVLADEKTDLILGAHILGPDAGTTIHELVAAMEFGASVEELSRMSHAHPTVNEAVREAALAAHGRAIHI
ncbi:dihydrolipoyl dehydrogenase [Nitrospira sp.]|nr:dihydrolipoyl dehydrogenase [Nitrospira sp.]